MEWYSCQDGRVLISFWFLACLERVAKAIATAVANGSTIEVVHIDQPWADVLAKWMVGPQSIETRFRKAMKDAYPVMVVCTQWGCEFFGETPAAKKIAAFLCKDHSCMMDVKGVHQFKFSAVVTKLGSGVFTGRA